MFNMAAYAELKQILDELTPREDALMPNELEMLHSLRDKYLEPLAVDPFDTAALNVMLRNIDIRKGYDFDARKDAGRVIDLPRKDDGADG